MPSAISAAIETGKASLHECETIYSVGDVYLLLEVTVVSAHNKRRIEEWMKDRD